MFEMKVSGIRIGLVAAKRFNIYVSKCVVRNDLGMEVHDVFT